MSTTTVARITRPATIEYPHTLFKAVHRRSETILRTLRELTSHTHTFAQQNRRLASILSKHHSLTMSLQSQSAQSTTGVPSKKRSRKICIRIPLERFQEHLAFASKMKGEFQDLKVLSEKQPPDRFTIQVLSFFYLDKYQEFVEELAWSERRYQDKSLALPIFEHTHACSHITYSPQPHDQTKDCPVCSSTDSNTLSIQKLFELAMAESLCRNKVAHLFSPENQASLSKAFKHYFSGQRCMGNTHSLVQSLIQALDSFSPIDSTMRITLQTLLRRYALLFNTRQLGSFLIETDPSSIESIIAARSTGKRARYELCVMVQNQIENLALHETTIIPFLSPDHAIVLEFRRSDTGIDAIVYNTAIEGNPCHGQPHEKQSEHHTYFYPALYQNIQKAQLTELIDKVVKLTTTLIELGMDGTRFADEYCTSVVRGLYDLLQAAALHPPSNPTEDPSLIPYKEQSFGSCQVSSLHAWLRQYFYRLTNGAHLYQQFKHHLLQQRYEVLVQQADKLTEFPPQERNTLLSLIQEVVQRRLAKISPQGEP